jgi:CRP-like cAMP-binding protein
MDPVLLLNLGYGLNFLALVVKDVLWLRGMLLPAQVSFLFWGATQNYVWTVVWNVLFVGINTVQIVRIIRERRPIELPAELEDLHRSVFSVMKPREFLLFWETGNLTEVADRPFVREGKYPDALLFLVSGEAKVMKEGTTIARLGRGSFVAELSFLSGEPASADVVAEGAVEYNSWTHQKLRRIEKFNPDLSRKIQGIVGRDISHKIRATSTRLKNAN